MGERPNRRAFRNQDQTRSNPTKAPTLVGFALHRRETKVLLASLTLLGLISVQLDVFEALVRFMDRHETWELDEIVVVLFFVGIAAIGLLVVRAKDLRNEIHWRGEAEQRASTLARHDPLTGLPNRRFFQEELGAELASARGECAVFLIDLDRFKSVNDVYGHSVGDAFLVEIANRLRANINSGDLIARLGGDEFACVIRSCVTPEAIAALAARLSEVLNGKVEVQGIVLHSGATIGIASSRADGTTPEELLRAADIALYQGKREGRATYRLFDGKRDDAMAERAKLEGELREAIEGGQIQPYFQPITLLSTGEIVGFEALARWVHPSRGIIAPDVFIPIAEDAGLINKLTDVMLEQACRTARTWPAGVRLSINISPVQLKDSLLAQRMLAALRRAGFSPQNLLVEVTETAIIQEYEAASANLESLQKSGVQIALDDFGKGHSSLSYLHRLKFDHIKIDSSFVMSLEKADNEKIVTAVVGLGKALEMPVTAEGIESESAAATLRLLGCEYGQGYLFGRPMPGAETRKLVGTGSKPYQKLRQAS